jgi:hypothetical protein
MEVGKNILEVIEEKRLRCFGHVKRMPGNRLPLKNFRMGTRGNAKWKIQREMDRWSKTEHDKPWTDRRERDRDRWRNLVLCKGKPR